MSQPDCGELVWPHSLTTIHEDCAAYQVLRLAVFLNELPDLGICFACWPFLTVPSQVFWQECLIEVQESVWVFFPFLKSDCSQVFCHIWGYWVPSVSLDDSVGVTHHFGVWSILNRKIDKNNLSAWWMYVWEIIPVDALFILYFYFCQATRTSVLFQEQSLLIPLANHM